MSSVPLKQHSWAQGRHKLIRQDEESQSCGRLQAKDRRPHAKSGEKMQQEETNCEEGSTKAIGDPGIALADCSRYQPTTVTSKDNGCHNVLSQASKYHEFWATDVIVYIITPNISFCVFQCIFSQQDLLNYLLDATCLKTYNFKKCFEGIYVFNYKPLKSQ